MTTRRTRIILGTAFAVLAIALAGAATGYLAAKLAARPPATAGASALGVALRLGVIVGAVYLVMALHELGHTLAGLSQRFRFVMWAVGPLWVSRENGALRLRFNRNLSMWGGMAATLPQDTANIVRRFAWAVAGGPATSLGLAATAAAAWAATSADLSLVRLGLATSAVTSAVIFLVTAQPFGAGGGFASDGGRLLRLLRGGEPAAQEAAMLTLYSLALTGVRPREWPADAVETALTLRDGGPYEAATCSMAVQHFFDRGETERAGGLLDRLLGLWPGLHDLVRAGVAADAAFFLAFVREDAARAAEVLAEARGPLVERHRVLRAKAAVLLAEGDRSGALAVALEAKDALARPFLEANDMDRELIDRVVERAELATPAAMQ